MVLIDKLRARNKQKMEADALDDLEDYFTEDEECYVSIGNKYEKTKGKKETDAEKAALNANLRLRRQNALPSQLYTFGHARRPPLHVHRQLEHP